MTTSDSGSRTRLRRIAHRAMVERGFIDFKRVGGGHESRALAPAEGSDETGR